MNVLPKKIALLATAIVSLSLSACGGGGGGGGGGPSSPPPPPPPPADPLGPVGTVAEEQDRLFESVGMNIIVPGYAAMATSMTALETGAGAYCADPVNGDLSAFQNDWRAAMTSSSVERMAWRLASSSNSSVTSKPWARRKAATPPASLRG